MSKIKEQAQRLIDLALKKDVTEADRIDSYDGGNAATQRLVDTINEQSRLKGGGKGQMVVLVTRGSSMLVFDVKLTLDHPFIDKDKYESGGAFVYLSDDFYVAVDEAAERLGHKVIWNNTKTTGWLSTNQFNRGII